MRIGTRIAAIGSALVTAALVLVPAAQDAGAAQAATPITFSHARPVDIQRLGAEPEVKIDSRGNEYVTAPIGIQYATSFLWKSEDAGTSFDLLRAFPPLQRPNPSYASGDATIAIAPPAPGSTQDALVWSDLANLAGLQNAATFDGGNTFPPEYWNEFNVGAGPAADRQWLAAMTLPNGTERIYQYYDQVHVDGNSIIYTDDYGKNWTLAGRDQGMGQPNPGNIVADPVNHVIYMASVSGSTAVVSRCDQDGKNCVEFDAGQGSSDLANLFDIVAVDTSGNVYVAFTDAKAVYLASSSDQGETWQQTRVSPTSQKATIMPWVVAGDAGRVWVTWYGTTHAGAPSGNTGPWETFAAQSLTALDPQPTFQTVTVSDHPNHDNAICEGGIGCTAGFGPAGSVVGGSPEDRNMLDDFSCAIDPQGMLHVVFNDTNNQVTLSPDKDAGGAFIMESTQLSGPSLFTSVGDVAPAPDAPAVSSAGVSNGTLQVAGTQSLPPGNWARDAAGDAHLPRHGSGGPGASDAALDIRSASVVPSESVAQAKIQLEGAPAVTTAGGRPVLYVVYFWTPPGNVYYAAAEFIGGQYVNAWVGQPDPAVVNSAGVPKIVTYQFLPGFASTTTATFDQATKTLSIPIAPSLIGNPTAGTRFDSVSGLSFVLNGPPGAEGLMDEVDASSATSWRWGDQPAPAGTVELAVDDPTFANAVLGSLTNYPGPDWTATVPVAGLASGQHTLYVRQVANGFASAPVAVPFSV